MNIVLALAGAVFAVPKRYVVMFKMPDNLSVGSIKAFSNEATTRTKNLFEKDDIIHKKNMTGYSATLSESTRKKLLQDPSVELVEEDVKIKISSQDLQILEGNAITFVGPPFEKIHSWIIGDGWAGSAAEGHTSLVKEADLPERQSDDYNFILQKSAPWGISRISGHEHDCEYLENAGKDVNVYVLDTGIDIKHPDFEGRAIWGYNSVENSPDVDEHGHGTHCAGIIGGKRTGIAKYANLIAVKSLNKHGEGLISSLIEGIEYVIIDHDRRMNLYYDAAEDNYFNNSSMWGYGGISALYRLFPSFRSVFEVQSGKKPKAVVNMSIGGVRSPAVNFAVRYATEKLGIHFVTAAGNESDNACAFSPASSQSTITVGARGPDNEIANFSNIGPCVDVYAPGIEILSTWPGGAIKFASGTSMASPHVAGVMAVYLGIQDYEPKELRERIMKDTIKTITSNEGGEGSNMMKPLRTIFNYVFEERLLSTGKATRIEFWPFSSSDKDGPSADKEPMVSLEKLYRRLKTNKLNKV